MAPPAQSGRNEHPLPRRCAAERGADGAARRPYRPNRSSVKMRPGPRSPRWRAVAGSLYSAPTAMTLRAILTLGGLALALFWPTAARGHTPSETYLTLFVSPTNIAGQWDVSLLDLQQGLRLEPDAFKALAPDE